MCLALNVSRKMVYRMIQAGVLPAPKKRHNFRQVYFVRAELEKACRKALR